MAAPLRIVIVYKGDECCVCHKSNGKENILPNSHDLLVLKRCKRKMHEIAETIILLELRHRKVKSQRMIPKHWLVQIIKWSTGANLSRPIKGRWFKYSCSHSFHDHCDAQIRRNRPTKKSICPLCRKRGALRELTLITVQAVLRFI